MESYWELGVMVSWMWFESYWELGVMESWVWWRAGCDEDLLRAGCDGELNVMGELLGAGCDGELGVVENLMWLRDNKSWVWWWAGWDYEILRARCNGEQGAMESWVWWRAGCDGELQRSVCDDGELPRCSLGSYFYLHPWDAYLLSWAIKERLLCPPPTYFWPIRVLLVGPLLVSTEINARFIIKTLIILPCRLRIGGFIVIKLSGYWLVGNEILRGMQNLPTVE